MTWRSAAFESRSKTWSKPTLNRNKGEKSKAVLIATSSAERHGYEGRPKSGRPLDLPDPIRHPAPFELGIGAAGVKGVGLGLPAAFAGDLSSLRRRPSSGP